MDGALPSVVAGLVDAPVVAVPTSIGYGRLEVLALWADCLVDRGDAFKGKATRVFRLMAEAWARAQPKNAMARCRRSSVASTLSKHPPTPCAFADRKFKRRFRSPDHTSGAP